MKNMFLLFYCCFFVFQLSAQEEEVKLMDTFSREPIPILVEPMRFPEGLPIRMVKQLEQTAYALIENHWHLKVINHSSAENTGDIDPEYIFQLSLEPLIDDLSQHDILDSNKQVIGTAFSITSGLAANLRVTSIVTGELKYTRDIKITNYSVGRKYKGNPVLSFTSGRKAATPQNPGQEAAVLQEEKNNLLIKAIGEWGAAIQKELNGLFPVMVHMVEMLDGSEKKPKVIRIDAGSRLGFIKNQMLYIISLKVYEAMGEQFVRQERIGYLYLKEISEDSSTGRIYSRKAVGAALANGQQLFFVVPE